MVTVLDTDRYVKLVKFYRTRPTEFVKDVNGFDLTEQQKEVIEKVPQALKEGKSISVKAGHS